MGDKSLNRLHRLLVTPGAGRAGPLPSSTWQSNSRAWAGACSPSIPIPQGRVSISFGSDGLDDATQLEDLLDNQRLKPVVATIEIVPVNGWGLLKCKPPQVDGAAGRVLPWSCALNDVTAAILGAGYGILDRGLDSSRTSTTSASPTAKTRRRSPLT